MAAPMWNRFPCKILEIRLDKTLACGQSFRWKEHQPGIWTGVIGNAVWRLKQTDDEILYQLFPNPGMPKLKPDPVKLEAIEQEKGTEQEDEATIKEIKTEKVLLPSAQNGCTNLLIKCKSTSHHARDTNDSVKSEVDVLQDYLQLNVCLETLYETWSKSDTHFAKISKQFTGIRMLRQEPVECLFSFICSTNNNISRITSMVEKLAVNYGDKITTLDDIEYYTFPRVASLAQDGVEEKLRALGFGYRAKYIQKSARYIEENGGEKWLYSLRDMHYKDSKANLIKLCGVGPKVADCVALMCLDKAGTVPVDTHVWQIAARDYMPKLKQAKSLTDKLYDEIGDYFRDLWGPYAGWAHSVLFAADLKQFKGISEPKAPDNLKKPALDATPAKPSAPKKRKKTRSKT